MHFLLIADAYALNTIHSINDYDDDYVDARFNCCAHELFHFGYYHDYDCGDYFDCSLIIL